MKIKDMAPKISNRSAISVLLAHVVFLSGCVVPMPYAPSTQSLADLDDTPLVTSELGGPKPEAGNAILAMRSGRVLVVRASDDRSNPFQGLPIPLDAPDKVRAYVAPFSFSPFRPGERHQYGFVITPEFAQASQLFLSGDGKGALKAFDAILAKAGQSPALLWQASYFRANTLHILEGRPDLAEVELLRTEALEIKASGRNHVARSLRAEVRLWSGDTAGAARDAAQVVRAIGTWRSPTVFLTPPSDEFELGRVGTAQAISQLVLGHVLARHGDFKGALPWFQVVDQELNDGMYVARHPFYGNFFRVSPDLLYGRGDALASHGMAVLGLDPSGHGSEDLFQKARAYFDAAGFRAGTLWIQHYKCNALYHTGQFERLAAEAQAGIDEAEKLGANEHLWLFNAFRGTALLRLQKWDAAEQSLRAAQSLLDLISGTSSSQNTEMRAAIGKEAITEGLVALGLRKQGAEAQLFEDLERGRARSFVALLASRSVAIGRQEALVSRIRRLDEEIAKERGRKTAIVTDPTLRPERERELLQDRTRLVADLRRQDPELADALSVSAVSLGAVQAMLPPEVAMVYVLPAKGAEPVRMLLITRSAATVKTLAVTAEQLTTLMDSFNAAVSGSRVSAQRMVLASLRRSLDIDQWGKLRAAYVVPSGRIHFMPWGALGMTYPVAVLPNGGWVSRSAQGTSEGARAVVLGDPVFGGVLPQLSGARAEAVSVSKAYASTPLVGGFATEQALRTQAGTGTDVLHLATHALYDPVFPLQSSLILTDGKRAVPLTAEALFHRPISARMVVLSACETGMGKVISGDDLLGLARSFYLGGTSAIVSSLWPVEDEATRIFMEVFHERARRGSYGTAWLAARDAVRDKGYDPSSYGAFVLGGSLGSMP